MDILKTATDWAKDEVFSSTFFILFGILFVLAGIGFWQLGKTEVAKAFIYPTLIAGTLLLIMGISFVFGNRARLSNFETEYKTDATLFVKSEIERTEKTMGDYQNIAFKVFPAIIALGALLIIFIDTPIWRAISMTIIAMMVIVILIDSNAHARIKAYNDQLILVDKQNRN